MYFSITVCVSISYHFPTTISKYFLTFSTKNFSSYQLQLRRLFGNII